MLRVLSGRVLSLDVDDGGDSGSEPMLEALRFFYGWVMRAAEQGDVRLYLHCTAGMSRSATLATGLLLRLLKRHKPQAMQALAVHGLAAPSRD